MFVFMYVCICMNVFLHSLMKVSNMYVCVHVGMCVLIYVCQYYTCTYVCEYVYLSMYLFMCVHVPMSIDPTGPAGTGYVTSFTVP